MLSTSQIKMVKTKNTTNECKKICKDRIFPTTHEEYKVRMSIIRLIEKLSLEFLWIFTLIVAINLILNHTRHLTVQTRCQISSSEGNQLSKNLSIIDDYYIIHCQWIRMKKVIFFFDRP